MTPSRARQGILVPCLVALAALLVLVGLGTWQLQRKNWKEGLIAAMHTRLAAAPVALPPASAGGSPTTWLVFSVLAPNSILRSRSIVVPFARAPG